MEVYEEADEEENLDESMIQETRASQMIPVEEVKCDLVQKRGSGFTFKIEAPSK